MKRLQIGDSFWLLAAGAAFLDESGISLLFLLAAALHECGHALAVLLCGGQVLLLRLTALGGVLHYRLARPHPLRDFWIAAAGPLTGFIAAWGAAACEAYVFSGANLLLSAINLLPVRPLDGGVLIQAVLPERWLCIIEMLCCFAVTAAALWLGTHGGGWGLLVFSAAISVKKIGDLCA